MPKRLLELAKQNNSIKEFKHALRQGIPSAVFGVLDAFKYYLAGVTEGKTLYVVADRSIARKAVNGIAQFSGKKVVFVPERDETLYLVKAFSKDTAYERVCALYDCATADVIVTTPLALMQPCATKISQLTLEKNDQIEQSFVVKKLIDFGYQRVESVVDKGTFAVRGDMLDVFAINLENPCRIDFFGDTVESIRLFDAETRRTTNRQNAITILPTAEFLFSEQDFSAFESAIRDEINMSTGKAKDRLREILGDAFIEIEGKNCATLQLFAPLAKDKTDIFGLLNEQATVLIDEPKKVSEVALLCQKDFNERYMALKQAGEIFAFTQGNFFGVDYIRAKIKNYRLSGLQNLATAIDLFNPLQIIKPRVGGVSNYQLDFDEVYRDIKNWLFSGYDVLVCAGDDKKAENFCFDLSGQGVVSTICANSPLQGVTVTNSKLDSGFVFHEDKLAVLGSGNLFLKPPSQTKKRAKASFFSAPETGDYCVHETHGVGRVIGSKKISTTENTKDYIAVEYKGGDLLYIPVEQMDVLTRYLGAEKHPKLSKIGGKDFERIKNAVKESIKKMSFDLKELYRERNLLTGYRFEEDVELQKVFANAFPFEETTDQLIAEQEIKEDMTSAKVMDRLVCGDVGFGKTEVAFRAVFRAIVNGKQAALLAPTTILTEQHFNTAIQRFKDFGIKIACLNRFRTPKQQEQIIKMVKSGEIDFVIGTHRLLSKDIGFKDLGLLVLDEEQRFGVEHKEKIKLLKTNVDTITLTATPIPRTLNMSLSGIRAISTINTPPKKRLPVQTYVTEQTDMLIKDALMREFNRGGQSFVLYNRVESIFKFAEYIKELVPELKITVAHGQMEERALEKNILEFYQGETDVLISTTIIENGIDLPKANTIIVIDADLLGLSTLYQLKGRVGRSDRLAYAYFTFKREKVLTNEAVERLSAINDFAEMGSGIKIAMRDLEIRGAGSLLGAEQHGHMERIGYELYSKLLREELTGKQEIFPELDIRVSAFIPESYMESGSARMEAYKEIAEIDSERAERNFVAFARETYGHIPEEVKNLINIAVVKRLASEFKVSKIEVRKEITSVEFSSLDIFSNERLNSAIEAFKNKIVFSAGQKPALVFKRTGENNSEMLEKVRKFFNLTLVQS